MQGIDNELIIRAAEGNAEAFEEIYKLSSAFVYTLTLRITNNKDDAQDVTQDVFIGIYKNLKSFKFKSSFKTWVYRVAVNTAVNAALKTSRDSCRQGDYDTAVQTTHVSDKFGKTIEQEHHEKLLATLLGKLNPDQRACIVLREIEGLNYQEISETLQININTVRTRLKRARRTLSAHAEREVAHHGL